MPNVSEMTPEFAKSILDGQSPVPDHLPDGSLSRALPGYMSACLYSCSSSIREKSGGRHEFDLLPDGLLHLSGFTAAWDRADQMLQVDLLSLMVSGVAQPVAMPGLVSFPGAVREPAGSEAIAQYRERLEGLFSLPWDGVAIEERSLPQDWKCPSGSFASRPPVAHAYLSCFEDLCANPHSVFHSSPENVDWLFHALLVAMAPSVPVHGSVLPVRKMLGVADRMTRDASFYSQPRQVLRSQFLDFLEIAQIRDSGYGPLGSVLPPNGPMPSSRLKMLSGSLDHIMESLDQREYPFGDQERELLTLMECMMDWALTRDVDYATPGVREHQERIVQMFGAVRASAMRRGVNHAGRSVISSDAAAITPPDGTVDVSCLTRKQLGQGRQQRPF